MCTERFRSHSEAAQLSAAEVTETCADAAVFILQGTHSSANKQMDSRSGPRP